MCPDNFFSRGHDSNGPIMIRYTEYYQKNYQQRITDKGQPLLITRNRKTGIEIALIPELCLMTGFADSDRANFQLMKAISSIVQTDANTKLEECKGLFKRLLNNEKCQEQTK